MNTFNWIFWIMGIGIVLMCLEGLDVYNIKEVHQEISLGQATKDNQDSSIIRIEAVRQLLTTKSCAKCHTRSLPSSLEAALSFYDLDRGPLWHADLGKAGIIGFEDRMLNGTEFIVDEKQKIIQLMQELKSLDKDN